MKYILSYDDEHANMCIVGGPFNEETAKQALKEAVTERLVELNIAADSKDAEGLYAFAYENAPVTGEAYKLNVGRYNVSIIYGGYEDRYQIVDYA